MCVTEAESEPPTTTVVLVTTGSLDVDLRLN